MFKTTTIPIATIALVAASAAPAGAFEWTIPASFQYLAVKSAAESHDFIGVQVPALWLGGPLGPFALHVAGGYAYQRERLVGDNLNFITAQADLDLELPLGFMVPYIGGEGMGWYPLDPKPYMQGIPVMVAPHAGVRFTLFDIVSLDLSIFGVPNVPNVWNLTNSAGQPYVGSSWGLGGRVNLNL